MIEYCCDNCGERLADSDAERFVVRIEVFAAADRFILSTKKGQNPSGQLRKLIDELAQADPDTIEDATYRNFRFDLCRNCQQSYLRNPLRR